MGDLSEYLLKPPPDIIDSEILDKSIVQSRTLSPTETAQSNSFWTQEHNMPVNLLWNTKRSFYTISRKNPFQG